MNGWRCIACALAVSVAAGAWADDAAPPAPIYQQEPYDQITVNADNGGGTFKILPLDLPERKVPTAPKPNDVLTVRMLDHGETEAQIAWKNIAKLELFEQLVLAEAQRLSAAQDFEAAYDHFAFLLENYPRLAGLAEATRDFRYRNAGALFRQGRGAEALMLLEAVYREEPQRSGLSAALTNVSQPLFDRYRKEGRFDAARALVARTKDRDDEASRTLIAMWETQLTADARAQQQLARQQFAAGKFREANAAARQMLAIDPTLPGGVSLANEMSERWPTVRIGVGQLAPTLGSKISLERTAERITMIATRPLTTLSRFGPDGPVYESSVASVINAANRRRISIESKSLTGYEIGQRLLTIGDTANSAGDPLWASLLRSVAVRDVYQIDIELQRPHPQPLAVLTLASMGERYVAESSDNQRAIYIDADARGPREVVEVAVGSSAAAIADLRRGQLDVVERIAPSEVAALANDVSLRVGRYTVPSVHVLIPNHSRSYPANSTFRRAKNWLDSTWTYTLMIAPLLLGGVLVAGFLLGMPGTDNGIIPSRWIAMLVGGNSFFANFFASVVGAFMYFATLTEVPIVQGLLGSGMGKGPALALLLAGPALSLPSMIVIRSILGTKKAFVFIAYVIILSTFAGMLFGWIAG